MTETLVTLKVRPGLRLTDPDEFYDFCQENAPWEFERNGKGELIIKMPTGGKSGARNLRLSMFLGIWALQNDTGVAFDSSTGFELTNEAMRSPDASWVKKSRLAQLTEEQKERFVPLVPDFVAEIWSKSDRITICLEKMEEYQEMGVSLGVLIDPVARQIYLYRPGVEPIIVDDPKIVDCSPELPGFLLDAAAIFDTEI
jgi:Uma2 family endonuclease